MKLTHKHTLAASYLGYITQAVVNNLTPLLFVVFETSLGISIGRISLLITVNFGVQMLGDLLSAKWINVIGTRRAIVAAHAFAAAGLVALGVLPYRTATICGRAVCGLPVRGGRRHYRGAHQSHRGGAAQRRQGGSMCLLHAFTAGAIVGCVVLSTLYFALAGTGRWALLPVLWAVLPLCNMVLFARVPLCTLAGDEHHTPLRALLKSKMIWLFLLMMVCAGASEQGMSQWASLFAETGLKVPKAMGDLLGPCAFAVMMGLSRTLYGIWGARISLKRCMAASCLLCVAGYAAAVFAPWPLLSLAGCALCGFSVGILWPGTFSLSMVHCPEGGTAMFALFALAGDVGCALGPGVVGAVSGMAGGALKAGLLAACAFPVLLLLAVSRLRRRPKGEQ
jgi:MFS family permease